MNNILELRNVKKTFEQFSLKDVSFELPGGFIMGFVGPNGAGKTTTIKLILNMLARDSGDIKVFGKDNLENEQIIKGKIGIVMDRTFYVEEWNLMDVEKAISPFYAEWDSAKYARMLKNYGLDAKKKVKDLSRGMKMKLLIAAALSHNADLLLLDEPTSGLDVAARSELSEILRDFVSDEKKGVLFSTHITSDLEKTADHITFIKDGGIIYTGTKDALLENWFIVKGGIDTLSKEQKEMIRGYREHSVGFDGLLEKPKLKSMPKAVVYEPAGLDEIILRI